MYRYKVDIRKVVDGDTVDVDIDLGFGMWLKDERVRLYGIDAPESRTSDKTEKVFGKAAKARLIELLKTNENGQKPTLKTHAVNKDGDAKDKYGRILGDFRIPPYDKDVSVVSILIEEGHGVAYYGQSKDDIQEQHMKNRERLISEGKVKL